MPAPLDLNALSLLDGGLATELENQGHNLNHQLWTARLLVDNPQAIIDAHLAYLRRGAQCVISASYQASVEGFMNQGFSEEEAADLLRLSVSLARQAVDQHCLEANPAPTPEFAVDSRSASEGESAETRGWRPLKRWPADPRP